MNIHSGMALSAPDRADAMGKRELILAAAVELFAQRGFHGTAVPLIAKRAGVGAGTVYRYFESKEAIVNAAYQHHKQRLGERILSRIDRSEPARLQFHVYWSTLAEFTRENPSAFRFLELHHHAPYLDAQSRGIEEGLTSMAREAFRDFQRKAVVKAIDPDILMALVHGAFVGFVKACDEGRTQFDNDGVLAAEQCVWEAIRS